MFGLALRLVQGDHSVPEELRPSLEQLASTSAQTNTQQEQSKRRLVEDKELKKSQAILTILACLTYLATYTQAK